MSLCLRQFYVNMDRYPICQALETEIVGPNASAGADWSTKNLSVALETSIGLQRMLDGQQKMGSKNTMARKALATHGVVVAPAYF